VWLGQLRVKYFLGLPRPRGLIAVSTELTAVLADGGLKINGGFKIRVGFGCDAHKIKDN